LDFVDSGKNLLLAANSDASDAVRSLALECGVELDDMGTSVYDHFSHQAAGGASDPTLITTAAVVNSKAIFGSSPPQVRRQQPRQMQRSCDAAQHSKLPDLPFGYRNYRY
jgi:hypothetical protein